MENSAAFDNESGGILNGMQNLGDEKASEVMKQSLNLNSMADTKNQSMQESEVLSSTRQQERHQHPYASGEHNINRRASSEVPPTTKTDHQETNQVTMGNGQKLLITYTKSSHEDESGPM